MPDLRSQIFPTGVPRDGLIVRTRLVQSWESQFLGLGRLTAFTTERMLRESFAPDDMAVNLVFQQRHRVEVGLKLVLERLLASSRGDHNIAAARTDCVHASREAGVETPWRRFDDKQREFIRIMDAEDHGATAYRFPTDKKNQRPTRGPLVDLQALEAAGRSFHDDVLELVEALADLEQLPGNALSQTARDELLDLANACEEHDRWTQHVKSGFEHRYSQLSAISGRAHKPLAAGQSLDSVSEVTRSLKARARTMAARIDGHMELPAYVRPSAIELEPMPALSLTPDPSKDMEWVARGLVVRARALMAANDAVSRTSETWATPYARQVHLDSERLAERMNRTRTEHRR